MRSAVFVDAGYLYAQGSAVLAGTKLRRTDVELNLSATTAKLMETSNAKTGCAPLLRIYWYDGMLRGELSTEQKRLAGMDNIKLRLGVVNWAGQQKGVDSLIVTDLVELARNRAITDAILLSGDEDLRIGVQIAQSFGVRVHLIGIEPSRGTQSLSLLQEADTTTEWSGAEICTFLSLVPGFGDRDHAVDEASSPRVANETGDALKQAVDSFVSSLDPEEIRTINGLGETEMIPREFDTILLGTCKNRIGRYMDSAEKHQARKTLREKVSDRAKSL